MKKFKLAVAVLMFSFGFSNAIGAESFYTANHTKVENLFKSDEEKTTKDAVWTDVNTFKVGVYSDGTNRDGYAQYVCLTLYDYGFKGKNVLVRVVDYQKVLRGQWVNLGTAFCK